MKRYGDKKMLTFKGQNVLLKIENTDPIITGREGLSKKKIETIIKYLENKISFILWQKHQKQLQLIQLEN